MLDRGALRDQGTLHTARLPLEPLGDKHFSGVWAPWPNASMSFRIALSGGYGRGVGTEAARAVVAHGSDVIGLHRISLGVYAFNPRAIRVHEKCGFRREGVARDALHWDGAWHGQITMAILATDPR